MMAARNRYGFVHAWALLRRAMIVSIVALLTTTPAAVAASEDDRTIVVASKTFTESRLLAEIMSQMLEDAGFTVERRFGLGGTLVCFEALKGAEIDVYPEYTGTLGQAILGFTEDVTNPRKLAAGAHANGLNLLPSFGFNNTYAMAIKESLAEERGLRTVTDLAAQSDLTLAFSHEFLNREDGWPGLSATYGLKGSPSGIEHGLAYLAIDQDRIDITDAYSTDGDLGRYQLTVLDDDKGYFPQYLAVPFVRQDLPYRAIVQLERLAARIDDGTMRRLNGEIVIDEKTFADVARNFLQSQSLLGGGLAPGSLREAAVRKVNWQAMGVNTLVHLKLTAFALALGCVVGLPLGVLVFRSQSASRVVVYLAGLLQTVPSLALLALMIPLSGLGERSAIIALFLYSLLPILRSTITALVTIDPLLKRVAEAIGLTRSQQLWRVLVPLAMPNVLAGVKTAAIISIGTATLAAFVGAGGLGEPIITGLNLNDISLILQGAIPAAGLAVTVELMFEGVERLVVKEHMLRGQMPA
jgi:osmoprotectant transport system permease protein